MATGGGVLWLTGLPGAGKTTLAQALAGRLRRLGTAAVVLDGDRLRTGLNRDLGFSERDRFENVRRTAEVAALFAEAGVVAIVAMISPRAAMRELARAAIGDAFREIYVSAPVDVCAARDPKGLYAKAYRGELPEFTGVSSPYDAPTDAALVLDTTSRSIDACVDALLRLATDAFGYGVEAGTTLHGRR
ncbi:adenylyl-sulfate kinase [Burkholderia pseudomultivorans]|nr:adenylyl-sulfate kinase [Burkholderia pseudomultivorans]KVC18119.1 adenylyl-sulfate kinase [Burkholderia pseudomultivorans]KVC32994.1 adenylyl-sulfate kinase [Burkholderia pseudomultivorans]KVC57278.1 adenylyl-sulfate kinase [Burkholderia pseudomultivorans]